MDLAEHGRGAWRDELGTWTLPSGLAVAVTLHLAVRIDITPGIAGPRDRAAFLEDVLPEVDARARANLSAVSFTLANTDIQWPSREEPA
jgi:hypothetical protein